MSLLLDTHVALWGITADPTLDADFLARLRHDPDIVLSPVSLWEITIKLGGPADLAERILGLGFRELPVTHRHAIIAGRLPPYHRDPFDRMLIAQATEDGMTLATRDADIQRYDGDVLVV